MERERAGEKKIRVDPSPNCTMMVRIMNSPEDSVRSPYCWTDILSESNLQSCLRADWPEA